MTDPEADIIQARLDDPFAPDSVIAERAGTTAWRVYRVQRAWQRQRDPIPQVIHSGPGFIHIRVASRINHTLGEDEI